MAVIIDGGGSGSISGVSDVSDLTTTGLTPANYLRIANPSGLEERTPAQVLSDIGAKVYYTILVDTSGGGDYTTLSAALAAASAGDAVFIRNGTYDGGVTISLDNVRLVGESRDGVTIQSPLSSTPCITITGDNVTIENVTIDGRRASQSGSGSHLAFVGIYINGGQAPIIRGCLIKDTLGNGITGYGGTTDPNDGVIEFCEIRNTATDGSTPTTGAHLVGIQLINGTERWRITNNYVTGWSQAIGLWYGATHCQIRGNIIYANYGYADTGHTLTRSACEDYGATTTTHGFNIWEGNLIDGSTSECIECAQGVIGSKFINNICLHPNAFGNNTGFGIAVAGVTAEPTKDILVAGNTLIGDSTGTLRTGMRIGTQGTVKIINNDIIDCANSGSTGALAINNTSTRAIIQGNTIRNCAGGIYTVLAPALMVITGNEIIQPASTLIMINITGGTSFVISNNTLDASGVNSPGISLISTSGDSHKIDSNTCKNFTSRCIDVQTDYNRITNNTLQTTNAFGAIRLYAAHYNVVKQNYCDSNNAARTIYLESSPTHNEITENTLVGAAASVFETGSWAATSTNKITPNHKNNLTVPLYGLSLGAQTVGASQATIAHGLPWIPREIRIQMTSDGNIWRSASSDATNIYLTADDADRTAEVFVR